MPRAKGTKVNARKITKGLVVRLSSGREEVVRAVSVVLHMANGEDVVYGVEDDEVTLLDIPKVLE